MMTGEMATALIEVAIGHPEGEEAMRGGDDLRAPIGERGLVLIMVVAVALVLIEERGVVLITAVVQARVPIEGTGLILITAMAVVGAEVLEERGLVLIMGVNANANPAQGGELLVRLIMIVAAAQALKQERGSVLMTIVRAQAQILSLKRGIVQSTVVEKRAPHRRERDTRVVHRWPEKDLVLERKLTVFALSSREAFCLLLLSANFPTKTGATIVKEKLL